MNVCINFVAWCNVIQKKILVVFDRLLIVNIVLLWIDNACRWCCYTTSCTPTQTSTFVTGCQIRPTLCGLNSASINKII